MAEQTASAPEEAREQSVEDTTPDNRDEQMQAEQESAAAMDADVPQPEGADQTTEGQPS
ncbi:MAG TPA: hypothetical protein VGC64_11235 [Pyrinomonadaceae bacterium]|jgi:hypothetical protein